MSEVATSSDTFILFELAGTTYGVRSEEVRHMEMVDQITPVPTAPKFVEGVVFSRGQVIPAINLRLRFGFAAQPHTVRSRLIVVEAAGRIVGLLVDAAREFRLLPAEAIQPPNEAIAGLSGDYLRGIAIVNQRLILLLDLEQVLIGVNEELGKHTSLLERTHQTAQPHPGLTRPQPQQAKTV
jgi:purine-binding chemotaxis protein CheW